MNIVPANLANSDHLDQIVGLLDHYARTPGGGGEALDPDLKRRIGPGLAREANARVFLAFDDSGGTIGVAVCFRSYSTFQAAPLINIHDLAVHEDARGRGVGTALIDAVKAEARESGCCRVTLEVYADNDGARRLYERCGFRMTQEYWRCEF